MEPEERLYARWFETATLMIMDTRTLCDTCHSSIISAVTGAISGFQGIASSETAFIAVRQEADRVTEETVSVASALPSVWSDHFIRSSGPMSMIMQPDGTLNVPKRRARQFTSGGNLLEWVGGGGGGGIILPPHETPPDDLRKPEQKGAGAYILPPHGSQEHSHVTITLFKGKPVFSQGEAVLFDSERKGNQNIIPRGFHLKKILFTSTEVIPEFGHLLLILFIGDLVRHILDIRLSDLEAREERSRSMPRENSGQK